MENTLDQIAGRHPEEDLEVIEPCRLQDEMVMGSPSPMAGRLGMTAASEEP